MLFFLFFLFGTIFGSFSTVLIERWHSGKWGIMFWRSECPSCRHTLAVTELLPILSYVIQNGKCHSCKKKIPLFYPLAEIFFGFIFLIVWLFILHTWIPLFSPASALIFFLAFTTWVYVLYDAKYMEVPDQIMVPALYWYLIILIVWLFIPEISTWIFDISTYPSYSMLLQDHIIAAGILYTFFYIQILIPGAIFLIRKWRKKELLWLIGSYFFFPILLPFEHWRKKPEEENGEEIPTWVGGGDLRIALFIGITLWTIHSLIAIGVAYIVGSIIGIFLLIRWGRKNSQIPFWPFLGIGWIVALFFHSEIIAYITNSSL